MQIEITGETTTYTLEAIERELIEIIQEKLIEEGGEEAKLTA